MLQNKSWRSRKRGKVIMWRCKSHWSGIITLPSKKSRKGILARGCSFKYGFFLNITFVPSEFWNSSNAQVMARCHVISQTIHFTRFNGYEWLIMWGILYDGKYHLWTVINCFNFFNIPEPRWFWFFIFSQLLTLWNSLASLYPIWYKGVKPAMIMNEMPVIGSLCLRKDFWDRQGANIARC